MSTKQEPQLYTIAISNEQRIALNFKVPGTKACPNIVLEASIHSLLSRLRKVPKYERLAAHQYATRHAKDALMLFLRGTEAAALQKFQEAHRAAQAAGHVL